MAWLPTIVYRSLTGREPSRERPPQGWSLTGALLEEVRLGLRAALHPARLGSAVVAGVAVALLLGPSTPGLVLARTGVVAAAVLGAIVALVVAHRMLRQSDAHTAPESARVVVAVTTGLMVVTLLVSVLLSVLTNTPFLEGASSVVAPPVDPLLLRGSVLLLLGVVVARLGDRVALPTTLVVVGLGMLLGDDGVDLVSLDDPVLVQGLGIAALVVVLFDGGLGTTSADLRDGLIPGMALATIGVAVTTGVTGLLLMQVAGLSAAIAFLIAAIVSSTDASAVLGVLRQVGVPHRLAATLKLESGVNDPVAVMLTVGLIAGLQSADPPGGWLAFGLVQVIGGLGMGTAGGWATAWLLRLSGLPGGSLRPILAVAGAGLTYGVAAAIGGSGFLAVYVAGVLIRLDPRVDTETVRPIVDAFARLAEISLFLLLGLLVFPSELPGTLGTALLLTVALLLVARPAAVALSTGPLGLPPREMGAVAWLGMRGAVPIVLATFAFNAGLPEAQLIFNVVFVVVVVSALVQGLTVRRLLGVLGLEADEPHSPGGKMAGDMPPR